MKRKKPTLATGKRGFTNGVGGTNGKKVAPAKSMRRPVFRQPKTELEQAIQRYIDLFDFAPIGYVTFDRVGRIEEINFAAIRLLRRSRRQLIGTTFAICVAKEDTQLFLNHLRECRSSDNPVVTELNLTRAEGGKIPALLSSTATLSLMKDGARLYQTAIFDLSERKVADAALREKEAELQLIVTQTPFMLTRCSRDLRYRYVSRAYAKMLGCTPEEIAGKPIAEIMGKEGLKTISPHVEKVLQGHTVEYKTEVSFRGVGGPCLHCVYVPDRDSQGNVIGWFGSIVDTTKQQRTEQALAEAVRQERVLYEFVQRRHQAKTSSEIYAAALDTILALLRCDRASILLFDSEGVMRFVDWRGLSKRYRQAVEGHSPWKSDAANPQPICIGDVDFAKISNGLKSTIKAEGIYAAAFIPLIAEEKLIGKFMTYYNAPHVFTDKEMALAVNIARQLALGISEKRAEEKLRSLAAYPRDNPNPVLELDLNTHAIHYANPASFELFPDLQRLALRHPFLVRVIDAAKPLLEGGKKAIHTEINMGESCYALTVAHVPEASRLRIYTSDITERKRAEEALQESKDLLEQRVRQRTHELQVANKNLKAEIHQRKGLEGEILEISDREQQRLGQELHDGLCQHLTAVAFMARSVAVRLKNHRVIEVSDIEKIAQLVNNAATDTRNLSRALHRLDVDAAGFITALEDLVDREIWKIPCRLEVKPSFHIDNDAVAAQLYRIAREAVINANKHAEAREIVIRLERSSRGMVLHVIDDGVGLSNEPTLKPGLGLHIMDYRSRMFGGRLEIDSPKHGGTSISCYLPNHAPRSHANHPKKRSATAVPYEFYGSASSRCPKFSASDTPPGCEILKGSK